MPDGGLEGPEEDAELKQDAELKEKCIYVLFSTKNSGIRACIDLHDGF